MDGIVISSDCCVVPVPRHSVWIELPELVLALARIGLVFGFYMGREHQIALGVLVTAEHPRLIGQGTELFDERR